MGTLKDFFMSICHVPGILEDTEKDPISSPRDISVECEILRNK